MLAALMHNHFFMHCFVASVAGEQAAPMSDSVIIKQLFYLYDLVCKSTNSLCITQFVFGTLTSSPLFKDFREIKTELKRTYGIIC